MSTCQHTCVACTSLIPEGSITTTDVLITGGAVNTGPAVLALALKSALRSFFFIYLFYYLFLFTLTFYFRFFLKRKKFLQQMCAKVAEVHMML